MGIPGLVPRLGRGDAMNIVSKSVRLAYLRLLALLGVSIEAKTVRHKHGRIVRNRTKNHRIRALRQFGERWVCLGKFWVIVY